MKNWQTAAKIFLLTVSLISFSFFSFHKINEQGLLYHDAGVYLLETKFIDEGFRLVKSLPHGGGDSFWQDIKTKTEGVPLHSGKPGLNLIFWLASWFGRLNDSISAKVTVACGILGLILTFLISKRLYRWDSAVYSLAFLSASIFYLVYSRSGLAEQVVTVFFLAGILFYLLARENFSPLKLFFAGICLGYASACNPWRVLYMPVLLAGLDFLGTLLEREKLSHFAKRLFLIASGFILPVVLFQLPYWILKLVFGALPFPDYWTHLVEKLSWITAGGGILWFQRIGSLATTYLMIEGPFWGMLVVFGWIFLLIRFLIRRNFSDLFIWTFSFIPFFYFSSSTPAGQTIPRVVSNVLPLAAMGVGELFSSLEKKTGKAWIPFLLTLLLLAHHWPEQSKIANMRSGYREASRYLKSTGEKKLMILGMEPVWRFYLGRVAFEPYNRPKSMKELIDKSEARKIRYLVVDYSVLHSNYGADFTYELMGKVPPLATFDNPVGGQLIYMLDQFGLEEQERTTRDPLSRRIYIFDIEAIKRSL